MSQPNSRRCLSSRCCSSCLASPRAVLPFGWCWKPSGVALATFSQSSALGAALSPAVMAVVYPAALLRATHGPVRGCCVCGLRRDEMWWLLGGFWLGRGPFVALVRGLRLARLLLAPVPLLAPLLFLVIALLLIAPRCPSAGAGTTAGLAVATFSQSSALNAAFSPATMAAAAPAALLRTSARSGPQTSQVGRCDPCQTGSSPAALAVSATRGPVRGRSVCQLRKNETWWPLAGAEPSHCIGPTTRNNSRFAVSVSLVFSSRRWLASRRCSFFRGFS